MTIMLAERAALHGDRTAIVAPEGAFTYRNLLEASGRVASFLLAGARDLEERPVAFMAPPGFHYVAMQWGIWRAGGIATPLSLFQPRPELEYTLGDAAPAAALAHPDFAARLGPIAAGRGLRFALSSEAIEIRGKNVFLEYWRRPDDTRKAFRNGWFRTGDVAVIENGIWRILGRSSVDIIKTGGEKVSALEVEEVLLTHPDIRECAVVGVPAPLWGERVCAALVLGEGKTPDIEALRAWGKERMAPFKTPKNFVAVEKLPRNAMGKIIKPDVKKLFA